MRQVFTVYNGILILNPQSSMGYFRSECTICRRLTPTEDVGGRALIPRNLRDCGTRESPKAKNLRNLQLAAASQNAGNAQ